ncbi:MAG: hypothetical protein ABSC51_09580 [Gaiellaceae bacterium]|jgi:plastocyanin
MPRCPSLLIGATLVLVLAAGCGSSSTKKATTSSANTNTTPISSNVLVGTVGPGFTITLTQAGKPVTTLKAGPYKIMVSDQASIHNFHLFGPGVDQKTSVSGTGNATWNVTFVKGKYTFQCDVHYMIGMIGHFTVT